MLDTSNQEIEQHDRPLDALAHRLWVHWSQSIAKEENISEERLQRWRELWVPYEELSERQRDTDRQLVERYAEERPDYD